jgi:cellulose synthase/poly-beta-1,6-N-acetylglucosamine synthase-like glycosyltransferase
LVFLSDSLILFALFAGMIYFLLSNAIYFLLLVIGSMDVKRRHKKLSKIRMDELTYPKVSIIAPAFNMENSILGSVSGMLRLDYPDYEVILVNDGSSDRTLELLKSTYELVQESSDNGKELLLTKTQVRGVYHSQKNPRLRVIDKENAGSKADALNAGVSFARHELFCAVDADSLLEKGALRQIVWPFINNPAEVVAAGGTIRVINGSSFQDGGLRESRVNTNPLVLFQIIEYLRAFYAGRTGWHRFNSLLIISGAFGVFKTSVVKELGGYDDTAIGEDMELVMRIHAHFRSRREKYKIEFVPEATCWTEVPGTLHGLYTQRNRWQRGLIDSLVKNWSMSFSYKAGAVGLFAIPYFIFVELLGPLVEIFIWGVLIVAQRRHMLSHHFWWELVIISLIVSWIISFCSVALERIFFARHRKKRDYFLLLLGSLFEPFGYRQLTAICRFLGVLDWMRGNKNWGKFKRRGFGPGVQIH